MMMQCCNTYSAILFHHLTKQHTHRTFVHTPQEISTHKYFYHYGSTLQYMYTPGYIHIHAYLPTYPFHHLTKQHTHRTFVHTATGNICTSTTMDPICIHQDTYTHTYMYVPISPLNQTTHTPNICSHATGNTYLHTSTSTTASMPLYYTTCTYVYTRILNIHIHIHTYVPTMYVHVCTYMYLSSQGTGNNTYIYMYIHIIPIHVIISYTDTHTHTYAHTHILTRTCMYMYLLQCPDRTA